LIRLVVGLGNPGKEYERTRHNAGFWLVERFAQSNGVALRKDPKFKALVAKHGNAWLLLPQSFMNLSGQPVQMLAGFFRIKPEEVLVVHDELDFEPGIARLKQGGGIAGHNGLKDISQRLASHDYWRLRIGVGRPPAGTEGGDYVLQKPAAEDKAAIDQAIDRSLQVLPEMLTGDPQAAVQKLHSSEPKVEKKAPPPPPAKAAEPAKKPEPEKKAEPVKQPEKTGLLKSLFGKK
jgi:PTH1 family peptidyl-tRNA hydrolase